MTTTKMETKERNFLKKGEEILCKIFRIAKVLKHKLTTFICGL